jgi:twitching motility protein PilT
MNDNNSTNQPERTDQQEVQKPASEFQRTRPRRGIPEVDAFLRAVVKMGASDLHLKAQRPPRLRIDGKLRTAEMITRPTEEFEARVFSFMSDEERHTLLTKGSVDFSYDLDGESRFRFNVYKQDSGISVAARIIPRRIPSLEELHLPPVAAKIPENKDGLVLVSGTTGSGKSTTIAAMLEQINCTRHEHIITIEDPIEFLYTEKKCLINQREVGINVEDFPTALRALMREDPDVVLIGEMRDAETFRAAIQAADTGHLVFGTVHAASAPQTIERVLSLFSDDERPDIRQTLAFNLRAIVCQKLLKSTAEGVKRVPAVDILLSTPIVRKLIAESRDIELAGVIRAGEEGMLGFCESLYMLFKQNLIDRETGRQAAPNPEEFERLVLGIKSLQPGIIG